MIAMAESVSHGCNTLRYITGETPNKEHPERVYHICNNLMEKGLDARGMWDSFKFTLARHGKNGRLKNSVVSFVISPPPDKVKYYNPEDWERLGREYLAIYDKIELRDERGKFYSEPTNILGSKFTMWLHEDSDSGVPHLHVAALRIDDDGKTNNDHQILQRAQRAAEMLAHKRRWMSAKEIREDNLIDVEGNCVKVLENMRTFSLDAYFNALRSLDEDYTVETKRDSNNNYVSYVICDGNKRYPASHIGKNRKYTVAHLEETWRKLREKELARLEALRMKEEKRVANELKTLRSKDDNKPKTSVQKSGTNNATPARTRPNIVVNNNAAKPKVLSPPERPVGYTSFDVAGKKYELVIPREVKKIFLSELELPDSAPASRMLDLIHVAELLFFGYVDAATTICESYGGGGSVSSGWGRGKDEDDNKWARRCAKRANWLFKPMRKSRHI